MSDAWVVYENLQIINGKNVWFWDILDTKTLFLAASYLTCHPTIKDAIKLMKQAYDCTGKIPQVIYTDNLGKYFKSIRVAFEGNNQYEQISPLKVENNPSIMGPLHWAIESRTNVLRGLRTEKSAKLLMEGWLIHYNFFQPRLSLKGKTPAFVANVEFPFHSWQELCEQYIRSRPEVVTM